MKKYYYVDANRERKGPFSIGKLIGQEGFSEESLVWCPGMKNWKQVKDVPEIAEPLAMGVDFNDEEDEVNLPLVESTDNAAEVADGNMVNADANDSVQTDTTVSEFNTTDSDGIAVNVDNNTDDNSFVVNDESNEQTTVPIDNDIQEDVVESSADETMAANDETTEVISEMPMEETLIGENKTESDEALISEPYSVESGSEGVEDTVAGSSIVPPPYIPKNINPGFAAQNPVPPTPQTPEQKKSSNKGCLFVLLGFVLCLIISGLVILALYLSGTFNKGNSSSIVVNYDNTESVASNTEAEDELDWDDLSDDVDDDDVDDDDIYSSISGDSYYSGTLHVSGNIENWGCYELYVHGSSGWVASCNNGASHGPIRVESYDSDDDYLVLSALSSNGTVVGTYSGYIIDSDYSGVFTNTSGKSGSFYMSKE